MKTLRGGEIFPPHGARIEYRGQEWRYEIHGDYGWWVNLTLDRMWLLRKDSVQGQPLSDAWLLSLGIVR